MLAKAADDLPSDDGWLFEPKWDGFRALVFRDGDEIYTQSRDLKPLDRYFPELADPLRAALPERCVLDGEVVIARDGALAVRGAAAAHPPGRVAGQDAGRGVAGELRRLGPARARRRGPARGPAGRATGATRGGPRSRRAADPPDPGDPRSRHRRGLVRPVRGRRSRRGRRQATRRALPAGQAGDAQDQAPAHGRLRRRRVPLAQERARAPTSGRCCSACSTTRARSITSGSRRRSRGTGGPRWPRSWRRCATNALEDHPWREWAEWATTGDADASGQRLPGATSRWNRGKDLSWEPLAHGTRRRGRLRPPPGRPLPARDDVQALAPGQAAGGLPLRPARGDRAVPAGQHLRQPRADVAAVRLGLVGGGWISRLHLEALERLGRTELVGVVSRTAETGDAVDDPLGRDALRRRRHDARPRRSRMSSTWRCRRIGPWRSASGWSRPASRS